MVSELRVELHGSLGLSSSVGSWNPSFLATVEMGEFWTDPKLSERVAGEEK